MADLPLCNNVYGYLHSSVGLQGVANVLRNHLGWSEQEVYICTSQFDGSETLKIRRETCEFETQILKEGGKWLFHGAVAGELYDILATLKDMCEPLRFSGYETSFEIYDEAFKFIGNYP